MTGGAEPMQKAHLKTKSRLAEDEEKQRRWHEAQPTSSPIWKTVWFLFNRRNCITAGFWSADFGDGAKWAAAARRAAECWFTCCRGGEISLWTASRQQPQQNAAEIPKYHRRYSPSLIRVLWFLFQVGYGLCLLRGKKPDKSGCVNNLSARRFVCETVWDAYNEDNGDCSINSTHKAGVFFFLILPSSFFFSTAVKCWRWRGRRREDH